MTPTTLQYNWENNKKGRTIKENTADVADNRRYDVKKERWMSYQVVKDINREVDGALKDAMTLAFLRSS